jgi:hypothetical protein
MSISRYSNREIYLNNTEQYRNTFEGRNVKFINQYASANFENIKFSDIEKIGYSIHTWTSSDRAYRLAYKYYGDASLWWVIFRVNNIANESQVTIGDQLIIPTNLSKLLGYLGS